MEQIGTKPAPKLAHRRRPPVWFWWTLAAMVLLGAGTTYAAKTGHLAYLFTTSVVIKVRDADKLPLQGAQVSLAGHTFLTDDNGRIQVTGIRTGQYELVVTMSGYQESDTKLSLNHKGNPLEIVTLTQTAPSVHSIDGYVQDLFSDQPITNVQVQLGQQNQLTNPAGEFTFSNVANGPVSLQLSAKGYAPTSLQKTLKDANLILGQIPLTPAVSVFFDSNRDGKHGIYEVAIDGTNPHRLVPTGAGEDFEPLASPDGNHILFQSTRDSLIDPAGHALRRLYLVAADGSGLQQISTAVSSDFQPIWSADSKKIYFQGYSDPSLAQTSQQVYSLDSATLIDLGEAATNVTFSPDSQSVAFVNVQTGTNPVSQLKLLQLATGIRTVVASQPQQISDLKFANDGSSIGYQLFQGSTLQGYSVTIPGGAQTSVAVRTDSERLYAVSPDGSLRAFVDQRDGKFDLYVNAADGSNERPLTSLGTLDDLFIPQFDPSGRYLIFAVGPELYAVAIAGGSPRQVTDYSPK